MMRPFSDQDTNWLLPILARIFPADELEKKKKVGEQEIYEI